MQYGGHDTEHQPYSTTYSDDARFQALPSHLWSSIFYSFLKPCTLDPILKMRSSIFLSLLSVFSASVNAYSNPLTCSGVCTNAHDPALIRRDDGTYFRFSTGGKIAIHSAPAITGPWTYKGAAIPSGSKINKAGKDDLWAPDVTKVGSVYYLYYSVSSFGSQDSAIGVATSTTLDVNSWTDLGATGVASVAGKQYNAIDPNVVYDGSNYYMVYGSFWQDIFQVKMANPPKKMASDAVNTNVAFVPSGTHAQEGAFTYKYGSYYYLFFSVGSCCGYDANKPASGAEYKIKVCRSSSVTGGYVSHPFVFLLPMSIANLSEGRQKRRLLHQRWRYHCSRVPRLGLWSWWTGCLQRPFARPSPLLPLR
jgi:arabinan endo-1,5-alpha-L-arabinosidase